MQEPDELNDEWIDGIMLADDSSDPKWKSRARGGLSVADAMMGVPRRGQMLVEMRMGPFRAFVDHVEKSGTGRARWVRQAIGMRLAAEGHSPENVKEWIE